MMKTTDNAEIKLIFRILALRFPLMTGSGIVLWCMMMDLEERLTLTLGEDVRVEIFLFV